MGRIIDKFLDTMRLNDEDDEDDYYLEDDEEFEQERSASKKSLFKKSRDEDLYKDDEPVNKTKFSPRPGKVVPLRSSGRNMEVCLIKPNTMEDSREVCDTLLSGRAVVLNMEGIHTEVAQRIIDFTSGACYSMNGNLQKISKYIFIVTPESIELSGDFQDILSENNLDLSSFNLNI